MFRVLQNQRNSKIIISRHENCASVFKLSRFFSSSSLQKQRNLTRRKLFASQTSIRLENGQLYFDDYDNTKLTSPVRWLLYSQHFLKGPSEEKLMEKLKAGEWIPAENEMPYNFRIEGVKIRKREDGMFVNFTYQAGPTQKEMAQGEIIQRVKNFIKKDASLGFDVYLVKGKPFIEDLTDRYPTRLEHLRFKITWSINLAYSLKLFNYHSRLRVEFQGPNIVIEDVLYKYFEPYGSIRNINLFPQSDENFCYALVQYSKLRSSICAKNCVHGVKVNGWLSMHLEMHLNKSHESVKEYQEQIKKRNHNGK